MASTVESGWRCLITNFNDFQLACLGSFFLHESVFFLSGLPFIYLERAGYLSKYKIQPCSSGEMYYSPSALSLLCKSSSDDRVISLLQIHGDVKQSSGHPGIFRKVVSTQIIFYFILEDFVFYWGHRILHKKWLYKYVHSIHDDADFDDYHHRLLYTKSGNYSSTFIYMDRIFGTDSGYRKLKALKKAGVEDDGEATCNGKEM